MAKNTGKRLDLNQLAKSIADKATEKTEPSEKDQSDKKKKKSN